MSIDINILEAVRNGAEKAFCTWEPENIMVITGRGGNPDKEVFMEQCRLDKVPVIRRRTGGGTVVLAPGMLVFSLAAIISTPLAVKKYTEQINLISIDFLEEIGVRNLCLRGLADICIGEKKILGSGMYMSKNFLFFQGSILVNPDLDLLDRYLLHPPKEPEYRKGRKHSDFVTSLIREGYNFKTMELVSGFKEFLRKNIDRIE
jgi:lipoate---protein ligase